MRQSGFRPANRRDPYLAEQAQELEASVVDLELRSAGETAHAVREIVEEVEEVLRHGKVYVNAIWDAVRTRWRPGMVRVGNRMEDRRERRCIANAKR